MRAYLGNLNFSSSLNDIHYADIDGVLTVHVGGFIGDKYGVAKGAITLVNNTIFLGVGAPFRGGVAGQKYSAKVLMPLLFSTEHRLNYR